MTVIFRCEMCSTRTSSGYFECSTADSWRNGRPAHRRSQNRGLCRYFPCAGKLMLRTSSSPCCFALLHVATSLFSSRHGCCCCSGFGSSESLLLKLLSRATVACEEPYSLSEFIVGSCSMCGWWCVAFHSLIDFRAMMSTVQWICMNFLRFWFRISFHSICVYILTVTRTTTRTTKWMTFIWVWNFRPATQNAFDSILIRLMMEYIDP